jgi:hypothetical protein
MRCKVRNAYITLNTYHVVMNVNQEAMKGRKNISIDDDTYDRLKKFGRFGESFVDVLNRLMDIAEGKTKK